MIGNPFGALRENLVGERRRPLDDGPCLVTPRVGGFVEEVRPRACEHQLPLLFRRQRRGPPIRSQERGRSGTNHHGRIPAVSLLIPEHVARRATGRHLRAATPRIPGCIGPFNGGSLAHLLLPSARLLDSLSTDALAVVSALDHHGATFPTLARRRLHHAPVPPRAGKMIKRPRD